MAMTPPGEGASAQWPHAAEVRRTVEAWRSEWGVPGAAVAVIRDDEVLLLDGFGVRHAEDGGDVGPGTVFELGSASKTFTATTGALAVDEGRMDWSTPLVDLLPDLRLSDPWVERRLTLLDALSHRTGLGRHDILWLGGAPTETILASLRHLPLTTGFREEFSYSNVVYLLAAEAIGAASERSWADVVADRVFEPLGMVGSRASEPAGSDAREDVAFPHVQVDDSVIPARTPPSDIGPAGGILASASDLVGWMRFHLEAEGAVRRMQEPVVPLPLEAFGAQYARASRLGYGAGWFVSDYAGRRMVDHIGGHGGMVANVTLLPDEGIGVAVLANHGENLLPVAVTYRILDLLLGLDERPWNEELMAFWEPVPAMRKAAALAAAGERVEDAPPRLPLSAYAGRYVSAAYGETVIEDGPEGLVLRYGSNLAGRLSHWHWDTFRITWDDPFLRAILGPGFAMFQLDMAGGLSGLTWTGFQGEQIEARRVAAPEGGEQPGS